MIQLLSKLDCFKIHIIQYFLIMSFVYLVGCTTVSVPPMEIPTHSNKTNLKNLNDFESWNIQGAIAVKTEQKGWNASFNWSQKYDNYYLNIFGPLGSNRISLAGNNQHAILTSGEKTYEAVNAETLLAQQLGWYMPVSSIRYWIRGLPAPGIVNHIMHNAHGQLISIEQQGWHIEYLSYNTLKNSELPALIELQNTKIFIRIAIHQWNF